MVYPVARNTRNNLAIERKFEMSSLNSTRVKAPARLPSFSNLVSQGTNDPIAPNSQERTIGERQEIETQPKLLKCKKQTIFSTLNVRSLTQISRKQELLQNFSKYNLDILSLQEHRYFHPDSEFQHLDLGTIFAPSDLFTIMEPNIPFEVLVFQPPILALGATSDHNWFLSACLKPYFSHCGCTDFPSVLHCRWGSALRTVTVLGLRFQAGFY